MNQNTKTITYKKNGIIKAEAFRAEQKNGKWYLRLKLYCEQARELVTTEFGTYEKADARMTWLDLQEKAIASMKGDDYEVY